MGRRQRASGYSAKGALLPGLLLAFAIAAAFAPVVRNDFLIIDDDVYVTDNVHVRTGITLSNLAWAATSMKGNWHPLTWLSHMADVELFGIDPAGHHLTSLLWHIANALLLFVLLHRLTGARWRSLIVAGLFGLHPLRVESVAWVAERKDLVCSFFWFLSMIAYGRYAVTRSLPSYLAVAACFSLGVMAKPMIVTLPFLLLLLDYWPLARLRRSASGGGGTRKLFLDNVPVLVEKIPLLAISGISSAVTVVAQSRAGAVSTLEQLPPAERLLNIPAAYAGYLLKAFRPLDLGMPYPIFEKRLFSPEVIGAVLLLGGVTALALAARKKAPYMVTGWLWFLGTLVPVIGIVQVGQQAMADRYTYVPLVGVSVMLVWGLDHLLPRTPAGRKVRFAVSLSALLVAAFLTRAQVPRWRDTASLFEHSAGSIEGNYYAHFSLGVYYGKTGQYGKAEEAYLKALRIRPGHLDSRLYLGFLYVGLGNREGAEAQYLALRELNEPYSRRLAEFIAERFRPR